MNKLTTILLLFTCISASCQTIDHVAVYLEVKQIKCPEIVLKQVKLETRHLKCKGCSMDYNNLFGFRLNGKYLKFDTWQGSIDYLKRWQDKHYTGGDYYEFLKRVGWATDPDYITKLKSI